MSKVILTDCDECIFDWSQPFESWVLENYPEYSPDTSLTDHWHVESWLGCGIQDSRDMIRRFNSDPAIWPFFKPLAKTQGVISRLVDEGWKFVAITACATDEVTYEGRWTNLQTVFPGAFDTLHCVGLHSSKRDILDRYRATYWVEDKASHAIDGAEAGHDTFLINYKHNEAAGQTIPGVRRVNDWEDIYQAIKSGQAGNESI